MLIAQLRNADSENVCLDKGFRSLKVIWLAPPGQLIKAG